MNLAVVGDGIMRVEEQPKHLLFGPGICGEVWEHQVMLVRET